MMDGRVVGIHMTTVIILLPLSLLQRVLRLLPALQHQHHHQVELVNNQLVVVTQHQHQHQPVVAQLQMCITLLQVILTTLHSVQITQRQPVRQLVHH